MAGALTLGLAEVSSASPSEPSVPTRTTRAGRAVGCGRPPCGRPVAGVAERVDHLPGRGVPVSIIALPDTADVYDRVNRIKNRERWRPFAGVTRLGYGSRLWERQEYLSRYMLGAARTTEVATESAPGVVHVDGTTRPELLRGDEAPLVGAVLDRLSALGLPAVLLNTSFNDRGEPIVNTSYDAMTAFRKMKLDFLVLDETLYEKEPQRGGR